MGGKYSSQILEVLNKKGEKTGMILVRGERVNDNNGNNDILKIAFDAETDHKRGFLGGDTKPYLSLYRQQGEISKKVWENECIVSQSPEYPESIISLQTLCRGDQNLPLKLKMWDHHK